MAVRQFFQSGTAASPKKAAASPKKAAASPKRTGASPKKAAASPKKAAASAEGPSKRVLAEGFTWSPTKIVTDENLFLVPVIFGEGAKEKLWDFKTIRKRTAAPITEIPLPCKFGAALIYKITDSCRNRGMFKLSWPQGTDEEGYNFYVARQAVVAQHAYSRAGDRLLCD